MKRDARPRARIRGEDQGQMDRDFICGLLHEFYTPEQARLWYDAPQDLLGGRSAAELVAEGRRDEVLAAVGRLQDLVYL